MLGLTVPQRSHEPPLRSDLPPGLSPPPRNRVVGRGAGAGFCLCGLGLAATATVVAFFGAGLLLLPQQPGETMQRPIPIGQVTAPSTTAAFAMPASSINPPAKPTAPPKLAPPVSADAKPLVAAPEGATAGRTLPETASLPRSDTAAAGRPVSVAAAEAQQRPSPTQPAVPSAPPPSPPLSEADITALLVRGDAAYRRGDLADARLFYQRALDAGESRGALGIGATYDPFFLRRFHLWTQHADKAAARDWYLRAGGELSAGEAQRRIARLNAGPAR
jgi:hypothetical protein